MDPVEISSLTGYQLYFIQKIQNIVHEIARISIGSIPENLQDLKRFGVSDSIIAHFARLEEIDVVRHRVESGMIPSYRVIDTCSAEFASSTPYLHRHILAGLAGELYHNFWSAFTSPGTIFYRC